MTRSLAAYSSVVRFDAQGKVWYSVDPLNILPGIAEARGDFDGASATYEALLERCDAGQRVMCCSFSCVLPRCQEGKATTPQPTTCMTRRSRCAGKRSKLPTSQPRNQARPRSWLGGEADQVGADLPEPRCGGGVVSSLV